MGVDKAVAANLGISCESPLCPELRSAPPCLYCWQNAAFQVDLGEVLLCRRPFSAGTVAESSASYRLRQPFRKSASFGCKDSQDEREKHRAARAAACGGNYN